MGGEIELEQTDTTNAPLAVDGLHLGRHPQPGLPDAERASRLGRSAGAVPADPAARQRTLPVRAALSGEGTIMKATKSAATKAKEGAAPSKLIDGRIKELGDWSGATLARIRALIREADPDVVEEWKWRGVPVWEHDGIICTGETYKSVVKLTFARGAALKDPSSLFNSSLDGNTRRAIDFHEGDTVNEKALKTLIRAAVTLNKSK